MGQHFNGSFLTVKLPSVGSEHSIGKLLKLMVYGPNKYDTTVQEITEVTDNVKNVFVFTLTVSMHVLL